MTTDTEGDGGSTAHQSYMRERSMPPGWIEVNWWGHEGAKVLHFCSWDCVLFYAGEQEPVEVVPFVDLP